MQRKHWSYFIVLTTCGLIPWSIASFTINDIVYSQPANVKSITVNKAEFGVLRDNNSRKATFIPTSKVILKEGNKYGWRIHLKNYHGAVTWREVIKLPKVPETWSTDSGEDFSLSTNGTEAVTKRIQQAKKGTIENFWTITPGDPTGKHTIEIYVNDRCIASFNFEVISKKK
ncbi:hypothetical protein [Scytonema sp. NUACC26]|uniref:hypothetical protein n=1 Tax=Scytonema sp. NUACC26 TaxID=3140176 RepID=UPI0034DBC8EB